MKNFIIYALIIIAVVLLIFPYLGIGSDTPVETSGTETFRTPVRDSKGAVNEIPKNKSLSEIEDLLEH